MSLNTVTFTADATKKIISCFSHGEYKALLGARGTWGSGTLSFYLSPDSGTTKVVLEDLTYTAITMTANRYIPLNNIGNGINKNTSLDIYATLSGSTDPSITVEVWDNN